MTSPALLANDPLVRANTTPTGVLLVADGSCPQIRELLASADAPVLWLDGTESPLLTVSRALERQRLQGSSIHTLHWFSHGAPGQLRVGEEWINRASLIANADLLSRWGLRDLALWSCEAGADQEFVALWEELTAAMVWSSPTTIGRLDHGDLNWTLRSNTSEASLQPPLPANVLEQWRGQLGLSTSAIESISSERTLGEFANERAFAALKNDGSVVTWGDPDRGGDSSSVSNALLDGVSQVFSNERAFAALKEDGSVVTWGRTDSGGDSTGVDLSGGVSQVFSNGQAFAALKEDGSVVAWGKNSFGGDSTGVDLSDVSQVFSTKSAFAALKNNGSVVTWGDPSSGGDSAGVDLSDVSQVFSTLYSFAALKGDGSVVTWGDSAYGGDSTNIDFSGGVERIFSNDFAFAALKNDGSVVTWGDPSLGGNSAGVDLSGVSRVFGNSYAFAALKENGSVVTWGDTSSGGNSAGVDLSDVSQVFSTLYSFAALKDDGTVVTWGDAEYGGGDSSGVDFSSGVSQVSSTQSAFAALKNDGSVVTWGDPGNGGNSTDVDFSGGVARIFSNDYAFAALKNDGSVVTWGYSDRGGNSASVNDRLSSGVVTLANIYTDDVFVTAAAPDRTAPTLSSSTPDDNATAVAIDSGIELTFSEEVKAGSGSIKIWKNQGDLVEPKLHESIDVSSDQVTIIDNTVTIQPSQDLDYSSLYFIQIGNEALLDQADNYFAGISDSGTLNFSTVAAPAPPAPPATASSPALDTSAPGNGVTTSFQGSVITFSLTFADEIEISIPGAFNDPGIKIFDEGEQVGVWFAFQDYTLSDDNKTLEFQALYQAPPPATGDTLTLQLFDDPILDSVSKQPWLKDEISVPIDFDPPTMDSSAPDDDAKGVSIDSEIVLKFSEEVKAGSGKFAIWKEGATVNSLHESPIEALSDQVTIDGSIVTIKPSKLLDYSSNYYISSDSQALLDQAGNPFAGISDRMTLNFTTAAAPDTTAPSLSSSTPVDNATAVAIGSDVVLTFSEEVKAGTGNIIIKKSVDDSTVATIPVTDGQVSISGDTVTINPTADLENSTDYYIVIDADALDDAAGNAYAGISDSTTLNFTTVAAPAAPAPSGNSTVAASAPPQPSSTTPDPEPAETVDTTPIDPAPAGTNIQPVDDDGDGIREVVTAPDGTSVDGNRDGIADATQSDVAGLRLINDGAASGDYGAISVAEGIQLQAVTLTSAETDGGIPVTARGGGTLVTTTPEGITNAFAGVVSFNAAGVTPGGTTRATLSLPTGLPAGAGNAYLRFNYLTNRFEEFVDANGNPLYAFLDSDGDGIVDAVSLTLTDGDPAWDGDGVANGVVVDPGFLGSGERSFTGTQRRDTLTGNVLANAIDGKGGKDWIDGDLGNDTLKGGDGNDRLHGGEGADQIRGGDGQDHFLYTAAADSLNSSRDTVWFDKKDRFDFSAFDGDSTAEGRQALSFIGKSAFSGSSGELRATRSVVEVDLNGDAVADFTVVLHGKGLLTAGNFIL